MSGQEHRERQSTDAPDNRLGPPCWFGQPQGTLTIRDGVWRDRDEEQRTPATIDRTKPLGMLRAVVRDQ